MARECEKAGDDLRVHSEWALQDLLPSTRTLGTEADEIRIDVTLGIALGVLDDSAGIRYGNNVLAANLPGAIEALRTFAMRSLTDTIASEVDERMKGADALDCLVRGLSRAGLDEVDRAILNGALRRLSDLT